jgi:hypothetical protein
MQPSPTRRPHPNRKLTQQQAEEIRARRKTGELLKVLAADYGVSQTAIIRIASRAIYR